MRFVDRKAKYPGRWTMTKSDGTSEIVTLIRNDEPVVEGTPMNANTLNTLSDVAGADIAREKAEAAATVASSAKDAAELAASSSEKSKDAAAKSEATAKQYADNAAAIVSTDPTLTVSGAPADAKAVGDRINAIKVETDKTLTLSGAAADAKVVGETLHTVTVNVNEKLQAASDDTNAKLDKLKKSISEKGRLVAAGFIQSGVANVALPEETDYVILRFAANTYYNSSSSNGYVERTALYWPEEGFLLARGGVAALNLTGPINDQHVIASFESDGWLSITSASYSSLHVNWEGYHYI